MVHTHKFIWQTCVAPPLKINKRNTTVSPNILMINVDIIVLKISRKKTNLTGPSYIYIYIYILENNIYVGSEKHQVEC
jgi:hypothetical protein